MANRGSGLAYVMMAMVLLSLLATTLLNMTYMGYKIKAEDRKQKEDYYIVTAAMDEIRAGLQVTVSDAIAEAYKAVMVDYDTTNTALEENFKNLFFEKFKALVSYNDILGKYDSNKLEVMITTSGNIEIRAGELRENPSEIILRNISLTYTNSDQNEITVNTDIVISAPTLASKDWSYDDLVQYRNWSID